MAFYLTCNIEIRYSYRRTLNPSTLYTLSTMKHILPLLVLLLASLSGYSQGMSVTDDELDLAVLSMEMDGAEMASFELKQELQLSEEQYAQVKAHYTACYTSMEQAEQQYTNQPLLRLQQIRKIKLNNDTQLRAMLNDEQLQKLYEWQGSFSQPYVSENKGE